MNESEIAEITKLLYTRNYLPGTPMVRAADAGDAMHLIAGGEALVDTGGGHHVTLKEGDFFGEMALLERRRAISMTSSPRPIAGSMCSTVRPWRVSAADIPRSCSASAKSPRRVKPPMPRLSLSPASVRPAARPEA